MAILYHIYVYGKKEAAIPPTDKSVGFLAAMM